MARRYKVELKDGRVAQVLIPASVARYSALCLLSGEEIEIHYEDLNTTKHATRWGFYGQTPRPPPKDKT